MAMHSNGTLHQRCSKTSIVIVVALLTSCLFVLFLFELNYVDSSRIPHRLCRVVGEWPPPLENIPSHPDIFQKNANNNQPYSHHSDAQNDDIHNHQEETRLTKKTLFATTTNSHHLLFLNFSHAKDQEIRDTLRPNGAGIFWKKEQEKGGEKLLPVGISVFHAMHCLIYLRGILQDVLLTPPFEQEKNKKHDHHDHDPKTHIPHCWSYITQQVMCLGDTTLEPARVVDNKMGIDGDGIGHMCKDLGGILSGHGDLLGRMARGEVFEGLGPWRDGQRLEDLFTF